ncbi:substrate-binding domain-containing protein [methane-oxidizing endosymbiont of Gigantopelta aegis]|uniref:substrate-binding domain-containing protein n=1 Tax=methane-oxidizing endosymbiont of Gigantopelta aegis TaxID=2794938 RepID=UPI0018DC650B|nr:substrate-binding domain-containing protein [methane-oxidizing endosymbiont of Gigantopelta aegis]
MPTQQKLRIIASDSEKLNKLRQQQLPLSLQIEGSSQALLAYAEGKCEMAGFHIAVDDANKELMDQFCQYLNHKNDQFILLEQRQQGLMSHPDKPVNTLQQLIEQKLQFVNRQTGSGTRLLLDNLLKKHHIQPQQLQGYYHEEHTHLAVATMIISRQADAGLGIESVAKQLNLHFSAITREYYFWFLNL